MKLLVLFLSCTVLIDLGNRCNASLIASSELRFCARTHLIDEGEPMYPTGEICDRKFVVSLAVQSGQVSFQKIYLLFRIYK